MDGLRRRILASTDIGGDDFVDLDLPSGALWARGNIVSDGRGGYKIGKATDYGAYFSWGNIDPHFSTDGEYFDPDHYRFDSAYSSSPGKSVTTDIPVDDAAHDAALALLGSPWHIPSRDNFSELYSSNNTDREWTTIDGVNGWKFMKKTDHSVYIFIPAAGYGYMKPDYLGSDCRYWTRTRYTNDDSYFMYSQNTSTITYSSGRRYYGMPVRAFQSGHVDSVTFTINSYNSNTGQYTTSGSSGCVLKYTDSDGIVHSGTVNSSGQITLTNVATGEPKSVTLTHHKEITASYWKIDKNTTEKTVSATRIVPQRWVINCYQLNLDTRGGKAWISFYNKNKSGLDYDIQYSGKDYRLIASKGSTNDNISKVNWVLSSGSITYPRSGDVTVNFTTVAGESHSHSYNTNGTVYDLSTPMTFDIGETITRVS